MQNMHCHECACEDIKVLVRLARNDVVICTFCLNKGFVEELRKFKNYHELVVADRDTRLVKLVQQTHDLEAHNHDLDATVKDIIRDFEAEKHELQDRVAALELEACSRDITEERIKQLEAKANLSTQHAQLQSKKLRILSDDLTQVMRQSATRKKQLYESQARLSTVVEMNLSLDKRNRTCEGVIKALRQQLRRFSPIAKAEDA